MSTVGWTICSSSEETLELRGFALRDSEIDPRKARPFVRSPRLRLQQMRNRQTRSQGRAIAPVKAEKRLGNSIVQRRRELLHDAPTHPGGSQALAFDAEKSDLIERIDRAQAVVELQAIDDLRRIAEPYVLRPQVAMAVHDPFGANAADKQVPALRKKPPLDTIDPPNLSRRESENGLKQDLAILRDVSLPFPKVTRWR